MNGQGDFPATTIAHKVVTRSRVLEALDDIRSRYVVSIRAAAGSGKSFVLRDWIDGARGAAYLPLDESTDAPDSFLHALGHALRVEADVAVPAHVRHPRPSLDALLDARAEGIDILVVDSIEHARDPWVLHALDALVAYASPDLRVVLSGRSAPPLASLAVLRVRDGVVDIDNATFLLDEREALHLFAITADRVPDADVVRRLLDFSGGWVAGFQLAAREWRPEDRRIDEERLADALASIREYLFGDVLARLPSRLVSLLVDISVLEVVKPAVVDALRCTDDSARALRDLERATAFVERVRGHHQQYRVHDLMRTCLLDELAAVDPLRARELHAQAAVLSLESGDDVGAMRHLIAAGSTAEAWTMFHEHWVARYFGGDFQTVRDWIDLLAETEPAEGDRAAELAIACLVVGRIQCAEQLLVEIARRHGGAAYGDDPTVEFARYIHAFARGSAEVALLHAARARELAGADEPPLWQRLRAPLGLCFLLAFVDRIDDAWRQFESASYYEDPASRVDAVTYPSALAHLALAEGRLGDAQAFAERALRAGVLLDHHAQAVTCEAHYTKGFVHLERNELELAEDCFQTAVGMADRIAFAHLRVLPRLGTARVHHAKGRFDLAYRCLDECRNMNDVRLDWHFSERIAEVEGHLRIREGDPQGAIAGLPNMRSPRLRLVEIRALAALGEHERALQQLARVDPPGARRGVQVSLVLARCLPDSVERARALREAVHIAEQQGYLRILIDERSWLTERLLALVPTWPTDYVRQVIDASMRESSAVVVARVPLTPFVELSPRELEVWRYLATPLSLTEIARRLYVSRNTMKTHVRNIYRKLGVSTREQAVGVRVATFGVDGPGGATANGG